MEKKGDNRVDYMIDDSNFSPAGKALRKKDPSPKNVFTSMLLKEMWDSYRDEMANIPREQKLRIYQIWSNGTHRDFVVIPT